MSTPTLPLSAMLLWGCFSATTSGLLGETASILWARDVEPSFVGGGGINRGRTHAVTEEHSQRENPAPRCGVFSWSDGAAAYSSVKFRVTAGSTGIPGPVVVETTTFFR